MAVTPITLNPRNKSSLPKDKVTQNPLACIDRERNKIPPRAKGYDVKVVISLNYAPAAPC